jgi:hypothetical protein
MPSVFFRFLLERGTFSLFARTLLPNSFFALDIQKP